MNEYLTDNLTNFVQGKWTKEYNIICLACVSGGNPHQLQRNLPCLHQLGASLVHMICSWINADVSIIQSLQSFRLLLLIEASSPQVWIWQHWTVLLFEKRHRFGSECGISEPLEETNAYVSRVKNKRLKKKKKCCKAEKIRNWKEEEIWNLKQWAKYDRIMYIVQLHTLPTCLFQNTHK